MVRGPWNSFPLEAHLYPSLSIFQRCLEIFLFGQLFSNRRDLKIYGGIGLNSGRIGLIWFFLGS